MKKVLITIMTHGNEIVGMKTAQELRKRYPKLIGNGLDILVANEEAFTHKKRFIDHDLNRIFPGKRTGSYEETRAFKLKKIIASYPLVIDIHSTESGSKDIVIVTKMNQATKKILSILSPRYVLYMKMKPDTSLISSSTNGVALEMGKDKDKATLAKNVKVIEKILLHYKLITSTKKYSSYKTEYFEVEKSVSKPQGAKLLSHIKNFTLIKKGDAYAETSTKELIIAEENFYPVIFGSKNYKTIFGFSAQKVS